ncbi:LacI family DNA-binding transcriptional regulator [Chelatococcus asaccharovorans]|uniref:LacI family transcriptional regulator n=1 Tax=Chelatococcus asaccharovorans TaxID=28210 RepID=A0A2V3TZ38_9HYPH|nr:LacI family DNA-binding transcriptional regulator [Chelatococcus asaccharovorans]PXW55161.1 LacI family transcriptional regulator [Chelatococcus asaccharovorans]
MTGRFVTSADVARLAGVSRSAVSRTFTPGGSVSEAVREKVQAAARELGYRVNRLAQGLHTAQSNLIGILGANLSEPFIAAQLDALSAMLIRRGLHTLLLNAEAGDMTTLMSLVLEYRVRAIIVLSGAPPADIIAECLRNNQRMILINRGDCGGSVDTVETDDVLGGTLAAEHLLGIGRRKMGVVRSRANTPSQRRRAGAFLDRVKKAGLPAFEWVDGDDNYGAGCAAARALLPQGGIDGVFCVTDRAALGCLNTARFELGLSVPRDVAIIGFDNIAEAAWASHGLTTISQPVSAFVDAIGDILDNPRAGDAPAVRSLVPVEIVRRMTA